MFPRLHRKLTLLYTLSTGLILLLILAVLAVFSSYAQKTRLYETYQNQLFSLTSRLQSDGRISDTYLSQLELSNHLIIYIEENGSPFFFPGAYSTATDRGRLIEAAQQIAAEQGIRPESRPFSQDMLKSTAFTVRGEHGDSYLAGVIVLRAGSGYKRLVLLLDRTGGREELLRTYLLFAALGVLGILLLYLTGRRFVSRSLLPLEETYKKQQDFVAAASHELRSPLAVIQTSAAAIADAPAEQPRLLSVIRQECDRGSRLIKNLLLLACADQNTWQVRRSALELDELLLQVFELYEPLCAARGGTLLLSLPDEPLPEAFADADLLRQVFTILLDNGMEHGFAPDRPRVLHIRASVSGHCLYAAVSDQGHGVSPGERGRIFERFYRADKARSGKEHFGLGLSIATELCRLQHIRLALEDTPGGGCTFRLLIPAAGPRRGA